MEYNIIFVILLALSIFFFFTWYRISYVYITSTVDGKSYKVKNNHLAQECADSLATVNQRLLKLKKYIETLEIRPSYTSMLSKYNSDNISENILDIDTSYTLNKRDIYFCLTPRSHDIYVYDINTLMFVAIHELAHICSKSTGHTEEFKNNFRDLIKHSINLGVYEYVDYDKSPVEYCGVTIKSNII